MNSARSASHLLTDFLNHGLLPFVGRTAELDALAAFWRAGREAERLRVALVVGEAGVGKSRLLGALGSTIRREGGVELRMALHPEAANAIAPQLTSALWYSEFGRMLLREEPDGSLAAAIASLRRLARLRPALVVIEDLHLLGADAVPELARMLDALAGEPISLLCTARPSALPSRAAVQPYLIEELELGGLGRREIGELWEMLLGSPSEPAVTASIEAITAGNPLALRSALRCAARELREHASMPGDELVAVLARDADLMHEGLVAHLPAELRVAAGRIAHLGEVVSRAAASSLVVDADRTLERLAFAGILVPSMTTTPPLAGRAEATAPLAFTHSLVHRHLADTTAPEIDTIARLIADGAPVYTLLPFELASAAGGALADSFELLLALHARMHEAMRLLDSRGQWPAMRRMLELADELELRAGAQLDADRRGRLADAVVADRLSLLRRETGSGRYRELLARALMLTEDPADETSAARRLFVLHYAQVTAIREESSSAAEWGREIDAVLERFPLLVGSAEHVLCLGGQAQTAIAIDDVAMLESVERAFGDLLDDPRLDADLRAQLLQRVAPVLLLRFESAAQLEERRALLERIREGGGSRTPFVETVITEFLLLAGDFPRAAEQARRAHRLCADAGQTMNVVNTRISMIVADLALAGTGGATGDAHSDAHSDGHEAARDDARVAAVVELLDRVPPVLRESYAAIACSRLGEVAWLRHDDTWMRALVARLADAAPGIRLGCPDAILFGCEAAGAAGCADTVRAATASSSRAAMLASSRASSAPSSRATTPSPTHEPTLRTMSEPALDWPAEWDRQLAELRRDLVAGRRDAETVDAAVDLLRRSPVSTRDMVRRRANLEMLVRHRESFEEPNRSRLTEAMAVGLESAFEWLAPRALRRSIAEWVARYGFLMSPSRREAWLRVAGDCVDGAPRSAATDARLRITMLGEIRYGRGEERARLRGVRNRTLLGLMVAIEASGRRLAHGEFCRLATGIDDDPERARKMTNVAVHRLRELLGRETIDTTGETPSLARGAVSVDLLEATAQLEECERALRDGIPARAVFAARRALATLDGEVAWPTLYGPFFEAARDGLEIRIRRALVRLGESLLREGDRAGAEELLRCAVASLPGDEELIELLEEARV